MRLRCLLLRLPGRRHPDGYATRRPLVQRGYPLRPALSRAPLRGTGELGQVLVTLVKQQGRGCAHSMMAPICCDDGPPGIGCPGDRGVRRGIWRSSSPSPPSPAPTMWSASWGVAAHFKIPTAVMINKSDLSAEQLDAIEATCATHDVPGVREAALRSQRWPSPWCAGQPVTTTDGPAAARDARLVLTTQLDMGSRGRNHAREEDRDLHASMASGAARRPPSSTPSGGALRPRRAPRRDHQRQRSPSRGHRLPRRGKFVAEVPGGCSAATPATSRHASRCCSATSSPTCSSPSRSVRADLAGPVLLPWLSQDQDAMRVTYSVFVDIRPPRRRLDLPLPFSDNISYIFDQQLAEGDQAGAQQGRPVNARREQRAPRPGEQALRQNAAAVPGVLDFDGVVPC